MTTAMLTRTELDQAVPFRSHIEVILDHAAAEPDRLMISDATHSLTAEQFRRGVRDAAVQLLGRGIAPGGVIALAAPLCVEATVLRYAAGLIGCATVVCPSTAPTAELAGLLSTAGANELIYVPGGAGIAKRMHGIGVVDRIHRIDQVDVVTDVEDFILELAGVRDVEPDDAVAIFASGMPGGPISARSFADWRRTVDGPPHPTRRRAIGPSFAYRDQVMLDQTLLGGGSVVLRSPLGRQQP